MPLGRRSLGALTLAIVMVAGSAAAQDLGAVRRNADGEIVPAEPGETDSGRITGAIRRDADGALIRVEPETRDTPREAGAGARAAALTAMPNHRAVQEALDRLTPDRSKRDFTTRQQQAIIDRVVAEERARKNTGAAVDSDRLTGRERHLVDQLAARDRVVREHEMRHFYAGRPYTALPEYWYVVGPDGRRYAVTGLVRLDRALVPGDPEASIAKLEILKRAALAPLDPSAEDRRIANEIDRLIGRLRSSLE